MLAAPAFFFSNTPGQSQRGDEQPPPHGDGALSMQSVRRGGSE